MALIETHIDRNSPEFQENTRYFEQLLAQLDQRLQRVR